MFNEYYSDKLSFHLFQVDRRYQAVMNQLSQKIKLLCKEWCRGPQQYNFYLISKRKGAMAVENFMNQLLLKAKAVQ